MTTQQPAESLATQAAFADGGDALSALPVTFLFSLRGKPDKANFGSIKDGPFGSRTLFNVLEGSFEGPRLRGTLVPPSGDWATDIEGQRFLDVRLTLKTHDNHYILMEYKGFIHGTRIHVAPQFQAGPGPYEWLNHTLAVGLANRNEDQSLTYRFYGLA